MLSTRASCLLAPCSCAHVLPEFTRYACRLVPYGEVASLVSSFPVEKRDAFRQLREWFDHSQQKNDLYRAAWLLAKSPRPRYLPVAQRFGLDPDELKKLYHYLDDEDRVTLLERPKPLRYTDTAIAKVMQSVAKWQYYLVKRRLHFYVANDRAIDQQDIFNELTTHGIRIIRRYEVYGYGPTVMASFVAKGMDNFAKNLATRVGKQQRNPLLVLSTRTKIKTLWYLNQRERIVEQCTVHPDDTTQRKIKNSILYYRAEFPHRSSVFVSSNLLYRDEDDADAALQALRSGLWERRPYLIDLTPDVTGDWMPTLRSLDAVDSETGKSLHEAIPAPPVQTSAQTLPLSPAFIATTSSNVQHFIETVNGDWDEVFEPFCQQHYGKSAASLSVHKYVQAVCCFCDVSIQQVQKELAPLNPFAN